MNTPRISNIAWNFDNSYARLPEYFFTRMAPKKAPHPKLIVLNTMLGKELGLHLEALKEKELGALFSGNQLPKGADPIAMAYAGHQFGYFTFLGDGRAHLIGEHISPAGKHVDIQFKGSGRTPYGMRGDGLAVLGPMLREYMISEAMHALHIPTTRSLAVVLTGEQVLRESYLPGAVLTRVASSHLRVGSFEYIAAKNDIAGLKILADYAIQRHYPEAFDANTHHPYLYLLQAVIAKQVDLIVDWMRVGFIHGVMNTDNMAISGETIDYGPCAFMDNYDPATVFSFIDERGRYAYANQPIIAQWNLARFAETLLPLLDADLQKAIPMAEEAIHAFKPLYEQKWLNMMRAKLGILGEQEQEQEQDRTLIAELLDWMQQQKADFTNTFRTLSLQKQPKDIIVSVDWHQRWQTRLQQNNQAPESSIQLMQENNPAVIPRNHKVNQALDAALHNDFKPFKQLLSVLSKPYEESKDIQAYQLPPSPEEKVYHTYCGT